MRRMLYGFAAQLGILFISAVACGQATVDAKLALVQKYLPDDARFVVVVDLKQVLEHPIIKSRYVPKVKQALESDDRVNTFLSLFGLNPLRDISTVVVSSRSMGVGETDFLAVFHGRFAYGQVNDALRIMEQKGVITRLTLGPVVHGVYYELKAPGQAPLFFAILGKDTIVFSPNRDYVIHALLKRAGRKATFLKDPTFRDLFAGVDTRQCVWAVMLGKAMAQSDGRTVDKDGLESLCGGIVLADNVEVALTVGAKDANFARELVQEAQAPILMAKGFLIRKEKDWNKLGPLINVAKEMLEKVAITTEGTAVCLKSRASLAGVEVTLPSGATLVPAESRKLYNRVLRSTVWLVDPKSGSWGTGTLINLKDRTVLTCCHVVAGAKGMWALFPIYEDGKLVPEPEAYFAIVKRGHGIPGRVIAKDSKRDLAVLRLDFLPQGHAPLPLAAKTAFPTQTVHSVGNPNMGALWVYTKGTVRQVVHRKLTDLTGKFTLDAQLVLTDSPTNPGGQRWPARERRRGVARSYSEHHSGRPQDLEFCRY